MEGINTYIKEELSKAPKWCIIVTNMFKNAGPSLTKEIVSNMLLSLIEDEGLLKKYSNYLSSQYIKEYLAYQPSDDDFINSDNKKICEKIAEFIINHIL